MSDIKRELPELALRPAEEICGSIGKTIQEMMQKGLLEAFKGYPSKTSHKAKLTPENTSGGLLSVPEYSGLTMATSPDEDRLYIVAATKLGRKIYLTKDRMLSPDPK